MKMKEYFIDNHKRIDKLCITIFIYCLLASIILYGTFFIHGDAFRIIISLSIPILALKWQILNKFNQIIHQFFSLKE